MHRGRIPVRVEHLLPPASVARGHQHAGVPVVEPDRRRESVLLPRVIPRRMRDHVHRLPAAVPTDEVHHVDRVLERRAVLRAVAVLLRNAEGRPVRSERRPALGIHGSEPAVQPDHEHPSGLISEIGQAHGIRGARGKRLLAEDVHARSQAGFDRGNVLGPWGEHEERVDPDIECLVDRGDGAVESPPPHERGRVLSPRDEHRQLHVVSCDQRRQLCDGGDVAGTHHTNPQRHADSPARAQSAGPTKFGGDATRDRSTSSSWSPHGVRK